MDVSIISITKNDPEGIFLTGKSVVTQKFEGRIEWLILDGSAAENISEVSKIIDEFKFYIKINNLNLIVNNISLNEHDIKGIYPSMNYAREIFTGNTAIFMNGGDEFYSDNSLSLLYNSIRDSDIKSSIAFGQARITYKFRLQWDFPGSRLTNIKHWLKFFEPNHQAMLLSSDLVKKNSYIAECQISADKLWKRKVLNQASKVIFINKRVCKFHLSGTSSRRPTFKILYKQLSDKHISFLRKLITVIRFLIPPFLYPYTYNLQKYKSKIIDLIF